MLTSSVFLNDCVEKLIYLEENKVTVNEEMGRESLNCKCDNKKLFF